LNITAELDETMMINGFVVAADDRWSR